MKKPSGYWQKLAYSRSRQVSRLKKELKKEVQEKYYWRNQLQKTQNDFQNFYDSLEVQKYHEDRYLKLLLSIAECFPNLQVHGYELITKK